MCYLIVLRRFVDFPTPRQMAQSSFYALNTKVQYCKYCASSAMPTMSRKKKKDVGVVKKLLSFVKIRVMNSNKHSKRVGI